MANRNKTPSPVLPLPPMEYDASYFNNLIRLINYFIQQQDNPGNIRCTKLEVSDGTTDVAVSIDTLANTTGITEIFLQNLPTSATGLSSGQVWNDSNTLKVVP